MQTSRYMSQLSSVLDRPKAYCNIDGVGELSIGFMCLSFAAMSWIQMHSGRHSFWNSPWIFPVFLIVLVSILHYGPKAIKERVTFPRTGYVEYRKRDTVWIPMILGAAVSAVFSVCIVLAIRHHWQL